MDFLEFIHIAVLQVALRSHQIFENSCHFNGFEVIFQRKFIQRNCFFLFTHENGRVQLRRLENHLKMPHISITILLLNIFNSIEYLVY